MMDQVWEHKTEWANPYWKFEAGTPNIAGAVGLGAAIDYLQKIGMQNIAEHEKKLAQYTLDQLQGMENVLLYGPDMKQRSGIVSLNLKGLHPHQYWIRGGIKTIRTDINTAKNSICPSGRPRKLSGPDHGLIPIRS